MGLADRIKKTTDGLSAAVEKRMHEGDDEGRKLVTMPGQLGAFRLEAQRYVDRISELEAQIRSMPISKLPLHSLHEEPGRRRRLTEEQFSELVENLRHNELMTPITVRPREAGGYEIVSGHNRVAAYDKLGRTEIDAVIRTLSDEKATLGAFYANLLQPQLPDFEKFLGFMAVRALDATLTPEQLAEQAGVSPTQVRRLLSYADLPEPAIRVLEAHPACLGATAAADLAKYVQAGKADLVTEAVQQLALGKINQEEAVRHVANAHKAAAVKTTERPQAIPFKRGKKKLLTIRPTGSPTTFRLDFEDATDAVEVMTAFQDWLRQNFSQ